MSDASSRTILLYDHSSFTSLAERLVRDFARVLYFSPWVSAFPRLADVAPGEGIEGVERVYDFWDAVDEADVIAFPDSYDGDIQDFLRRLGKNVWGSGGAAFLELDRLASRDLQKFLGIAVPPTERVMGLENLRSMLEGVEDRWVKVSCFRDEMETYHHEKSFITDTWLDVLAEKYGPLKMKVEFIVEEGVPGTEIGWDCHSVDGKFAQLGLIGLEAKDRGLLGSLVEFSALPEKVRGVYEKLGPALAEGNFRNYLTIEMRLEKEGQEPVVIDPCCRFWLAC